VAEPPKDPPPEPDGEPDADEIEASRAPLLDHLLELRKRIIIAVIAIAVGAVVSFVFAKPLYQFLVVPFERAAHSVHGMDNEQLKLYFTAPLEYFFVQLKLGMFGGIILAFPVIAYEVYAFIAPGLYKNERATVLPYLIASPVLFLTGAAMVYFFILPFVMSFALRQESFTEGQAAIEMLPRVADYLSLVTTLILAFGASFQMPVVLSLAGRAGLLTAADLRKGRRYAIVVIFLLAAFLTPPDPISQIGLGLAIMALYEISIWSVRLAEKRRDAEDAEGATA